MPFQLTEPELQNAFDAIEHHGYSGLVPEPPEWSVIKDNWAIVRQRIATIDLDVYTPNAPMILFAPKSRATVRPVCLLHPVDLIIYSALVLIIKDDLERERIPIRAGRVFSYRAERSLNRFYGTSPSHADYKEECSRKAQRASTSVVAIADIADFFPRIYQHRLENVIEASANAARTRDVARVLVRKFISLLFDRNSYGIPTGPYASRLLAEAVLIDVDAALLADGADFVRWVDDYTIFCRTETEAQRVLFRLAESLFRNHGLTLAGIKTKILSKNDFIERVLRDPEQDVEEDFQSLIDIISRIDPYTDDEIELTQGDIDSLEQINIRRILESALANRDLVDYERLQAVLSRKSILQVLSHERRSEIATILLSNIEHLYPIAESVSRFFRTFSNAPASLRRRICQSLLRSIKSFRGKWPPDYYMIWMLDVFASSPGWGGAPELLRIFQSHPSNSVRRYAALALHTNGSRADAVLLKAEYGNSSPLTRLAILMLTRKLGVDERQHWKRTLQLNGVLEGLI